MAIFLVNPGGEIERFDILPHQAKKLLESGYRRPTTRERIDYAKKIDFEKKDKEPDPDLLDIYFCAPGKNAHDGYGATSENIIKNLKRFGIFANRDFNNQRIGLVYNYPYALKDLKCEYKILFTMFESTKMPDDWGDYLRMADRVIVPSEFCRKVMRLQFGIDPLVINLGYDQEVFKLIKRPLREEFRGNPFTFLHYDAFKWRKGWDIVLTAYDKEFSKEKDDVRLILKTTVDEIPPISLAEYENVEIIHEILTPQGLQKLLGESDCFVFPSRGEGFGLTPLEAMATGLPVIIPNAHGLSEYYDWQIMPQLEVKPIKSKYANERFRGMDLGCWYAPTVDSVRKAMRKAYNDWRLGGNYGSIFSEHAQKFTIYETCKKLAKAIKEGHSKIGENKENSIIFLTEDTQHITGGRYYSWWLATALKAIGHDVVIYTNRKPIFLDEFRNYPKPTVYLTDDIKKVDVKGKMYFGSPVVGSIRAAQLAKKYNKPAYLEIFDPFPLMAKYKGQNKYPEWDGLLDLIRKNDFINIISLCNYHSETIYWWLNKTKKQVFPVYPCINDREMRLSPSDPPKKNWVTFVSRLDFHKKLEHVLAAVKETDCELHVITSIDGINFREMIREYGMEGRVKIHWGVSDREKFEIIKQSRATINGAIFEGFGMWLAESLACGIPVVCYDYPIFKEIALYAGATPGEDAKEIGIYFSEWDNPKSLTEQLKKALSEAPELPQNDKFNFMNMRERFKEILQREPKIGVVMCVLNEEKFIGASLQALAIHPNIKKIAVVEGCVEKNEHAADKSGLSVDRTREQVIEVMSLFGSRKVIYDRYGWAGNKSELRNRALTLLGKDMDYILVVDGDEVWKQEDLTKLVNLIKEHPEASIVWPKPLHFWKKPELLAVGSQWEAPLFRFFKYEDKTLHWRKHEAPVVNSDGISVVELGTEISTKDINFYHYGALKDGRDIEDKLRYYKKRDKDLDVKNTWRDWKPGMPTQWTHGGGTTREFTGTHPREVKDIILNQ